jgi:large subunit ribosomal protein L29
VKTNELRDLSLQELEEREKTLAEDLFNLKIRRSLGQVDNPLSMRYLRRDLARVKTLITEQKRQDAKASAGQE